MERLTKRDIEGFPILAKNIDYTTLIDRLAAYEDAEEQGVLIRFPCKMGDTVYVKAGSMIHKGKVESISIAKTVLIRGTYNHFGLVYFAGTFGNSVFATREEAEAALAKEG